MKGGHQSRVSKISLGRLQYNRWVSPAPQKKEEEEDDEEEEEGGGGEREEEGWQDITRYIHHYIY
jgi:hypothetical protein